LNESVYKLVGEAGWIGWQIMTVCISRSSICKGGINIPNYSKPNLLFIFADQLRAASLPLMGDVDVQAPNIKRLITGGVALTQTYSTNPVCGPARGTMMTGLYPHTHGVIDNNLRLRTNITSVAHVYLSHGYRTGYIGKWHLDGDEKPGFVPPGSRRQGFDYWAGFNRGHEYWDSVYYRDEDLPIAVNGYQPDHQTDLAIEFIQHNAGNPFCLFISWGPPHHPYHPKAKGALDDRWEDLHPENLHLRPNVPEKTMDSAGERISGYNAHIEALDANLGKLMDVLEQEGLEDNTIVVFTSDHGDMLGSQGLSHKKLPYEESIHIPFIIRYPNKLRPGVENPVMFSIVDFMPSLLALSGLPIPDGVQGKDLSLAILNRDLEEGPDSVYIEGRLEKDPFRLVRTPEYMLAIDAVTLQTTHLYHMTVDPYQMRNLAGDENYSEVELKLRLRLMEWAKQTSDESILINLNQGGLLK
jgi:arylsulfatase A-like enzyme